MAVVWLLEEEHEPLDTHILDVFATLEEAKEVVPWVDDWEERGSSGVIHSKMFNMWITRLTVRS